MLTLATLAVIGGVEGAVFQSRYRSAVVGPARSATVWAAVIAALRFAGIGSIASAMVRADSLLATLACVTAYAGATAVATWATHRAAERRGEGRTP